MPQRHLLLSILLTAFALALGLTAAAFQLRPVSDPMPAPEPRPATARHPVIINPGPAAPRVDTGLRDATGAAITASCTTCHATRAPDPSNRSGADLDQFHQGLVFAHGTLACLSCHNGADYDALRLASGARVPYEDLMELCAQCHAAQARGYAQGTHGGMRGYWDLTRGPRFRNTCTDCHDPHAPAFPRMQPTFKPIDRFLTPERSGHG
jgi:hypothetical protein